MSGFWKSFLLAGFVAFADVEAEDAYSTCETFRWPEKIYTACERGHYLLPGNFDVNQLDPQINHLEIDKNDLHSDNILYENYTALPLRSNLTQVELSHFNTDPTHIRFPLAGFLVQNRQHIKILQLFRVKLLTLTEADFLGFYQLEKLEFYHVFMTSIVPSTFAGLGVLPSGQIDPTHRSTMKKLVIDQNNGLRSLDWSVLRPVSQSLETVSFAANDLRSESLTCSVPFRLSRTSEIYLLNNEELDNLPTAVYNTFNTSLTLKIDLAWGGFCRKSSKCQCCELYEFAVWLRDNHQETAVGKLMCGNNKGGERIYVDDWPATYNYTQCEGPRSL